jgi:hypothetical protein
MALRPTLAIDGEPVKARIHFKVRRPIVEPAVGIGFSNLEGRRALTYAMDFQEGIRPSSLGPGAYSVDIEIGSLPLAPDIYNLDIGCRSRGLHMLDYLPAGVQLEIAAGPNGRTYYPTVGGVIGRSKCIWSSQRSGKARAGFEGQNVS